MAAPCWKCRAPIIGFIRVYDVVPADACPICMDDDDPQVCVAVPCGHHICGRCARGWAARQPIDIPVPAAPANRARPEAMPEAAQPPPWHANAVPPPPDDEPTEAEQEAMQAAAQAEQEAMQAAAQPAPWDVAPPADELPMPPPWAPALGEAFLFAGRLVHWAQLWRFGSNIVLVWSDSGRLCRKPRRATHRHRRLARWVAHGCEHVQQQMAFSCRGA